LVGGGIYGVSDLCHDVMPHWNEVTRKIGNKGDVMVAEVLHFKHCIQIWTCKGRDVAVSTDKVCSNGILMDAFARVKVNIDNGGGARLW
jgi:hypothetical protein